MIYILAGDDFKKKNAYIRKISSGNELIQLIGSDLTKDVIINYMASNSLFGTSLIIVVENLIGKSDINFSIEELKELFSSKTIFIFLEDKLLLSDEKKYKKYAILEKFHSIIKKQFINKTFGIVDAFAKKNKMEAWMLYSQAIDNNVGPEAISGMLFWKIKTMILNNSKTFSLDTLKKQLSSLVSLYHKAHRGEVDFIIGLEQFILNSLS